MILRSSPIAPVWIGTNQRFVTQAVILMMMLLPMVLVQPAISTAGGSNSNILETTPNHEVVMFHEEGVQGNNIGVPQPNIARQLQTSTINDPNCANNDYLLSLPNTPCTPFSVFAGGTTTFTSRVVIPCGQCVSLSTSSITNYIFYDGIDIRGKLTIDCDPANTAGTPVTIRTTSIIVQGQFNIDTRCKSIINGVPLVQIIMVSKPDLTNTTYTPISSAIQGHCATTGGVCNIGEKSITVAGGTVNFRGIPNDNTQVWLNLFDVVYVNNIANNPVTGIVLNDISVAASWGPGATILITSFTSTWNKFQQIRTITQVVPNYNTGLVTLYLNETIVRPTTILDNRFYAVEVALLSRNIQFTSVPTGRDNTVGGHFWIFFTPNKSQTIQGVDVHQFGQQGILGKYPIHFHHCQNVTTGTSISKNTIRQSFQRCVVIHGTNNVLISNNVAFDTFGHCFMLEDGIEINNVFERNLGAVTKIPKYIIPSIPEVNNKNESDAECSTFWITNVQNTFFHNVAAGSEDSGYWFELQKRGIYEQNFPNINPKEDPLLFFRNNIAHSNAEKGLRTYPSGYYPTQLASLVGLRIYRNAKTGIFFHISANIEVADSLIADNGFGIDLERTLSPAIRLSNVTIIGETDNYRNNVRLKKYDDVCNTQYQARGYNLGVEMRTWKSEVGTTAHIWDTVQFSGFNHNSCNYAFPIQMDYTIRDGNLMFDTYSTMKNVSFVDSNIISIDYCRAEKTNIFDIYITDLDGSFKPKTIVGGVTTPASIVSLQPTMLQFVDTSKCTSVPSQCLSYCQDTCFRGILLEVDPSFTSDFLLQICSTSNPTNCIRTPGYRRSEDPLYSHRYRYFPVYVPIGKYTVLFIDGNGQPSFPSFARKLITDVTCPKFGSHEVTVTQPSVSYATCTQLIRNGDIEASSLSPTYWLTQGRGLGLMQLVRGGGVGGSNALASIYKDRRSIFVQFLDTRCLNLMVGADYRLRLQMKLLTRDGQLHICDKSKERCPEIGIYTEESGFQQGKDKFTRANSVFSFIRFQNEYNNRYDTNATTTYDDYSDTMGDYVKVADSAATAGTRDASGFQTIEGIFRITPDLLQKTGIRFYIQSFNYQLVVDNVSMRLANDTMPTPAPIAASNGNNPCLNMVANSNMELGYQGYWTTEIFGMISQVSPGYNSNTALKYRKLVFPQTGPKFLAGTGNNLDFRCMTASTTKWVVTAQVKIISRGSNNVGASCDVATTCPAIVVRIRDTSGNLIISRTSRSYASPTWNPNDFNLFSDTIPLPTGTTWLNQIDKINIGFGNFSPYWELIWDDFGIQPL